MDLNKVMILGRLTRDPELRTTPTGINVCSMGVATGYVYTNQQTGQKVEQTEFHNVVLWRKLGEIAHQYLKKGNQVFIEGRLQTRSWDGQDGQKRYRTEIVADNLIMLGGPKNAGAPAGGGNSYPSKPQVQGPSQNDNINQPPPIEDLPTIQQGGEEVDVDGIPF